MGLPSKREQMTPNYQIVEGRDTGATAVQLLDSTYEGIIVRFGKVGIHEVDDHAKLAFDYDLIKGELPEDSSGLEETLGDILVDILENRMDDAEFITNADD